MKPLWLSLGGSDAETLFSGLFRKFFCHASRDYFTGLAAAKETHLDGKVIPAYLLHIKDLAIALGLQRNSSIIIMETSPPTTPQLSSCDLVDSAALVNTSTKVEVSRNVHTTIYRLESQKCGEISFYGVRTYNMSMSLSLSILQNRNSC